MVRTFLKVYMELGFYFLFLQEQIKDIIILVINNPYPTRCSEEPLDDRSAGGRHRGKGCLFFGLFGFYWHPWFLGTKGANRIRGGLFGCLLGVVWFFGYLLESHGTLGQLFQRHL